MLHTQRSTSLYSNATVFRWGMGYPIFKLIIKYLFSINNKLIKSKNYSIINAKTNTKTFYSISQSGEHQTILDVIKFNYEMAGVNTPIISTHQYDLS